MDRATHHRRLERVSEHEKLENEAEEAEARVEVVCEGAGSGERKRGSSDEFAEV